MNKQESQDTPEYSAKSKPVNKIKGSLPLENDLFIPQKW